MEDYVSVYVYISCPTKEEALKHCKYLVEKEICGTAKIHENTTLVYPGEKGVEADGVVLMVLKSTKENLMKIQEYILENHSWGTPCVEVVPITGDYC
ncbi:divalent cation tolerance protein CutA [Candidatus Dojkabacteria bacterium]|uniref:Divalent cation tolerance protein CutA n=1 Tax=Candidatus Dojkabacteria bacterium TaxID=2099670 RepID=A0A955L3Q8_9BACT|nr:divalent cation tolerance protein CutA [Candidatus Dojkabacteria bacterium]